MTDTTFREVVIDMHTGTAWGMHIGDSFDYAPPVVIFLAADVAAALRDGRVEWPYSSRDASMTVTEDGFATVYRRDGGRTLVYELFPARFSDNMPYKPVVYVGRWPD